MPKAFRPRVLLGVFEPMMLIGMDRMLAEAGADIVGKALPEERLVSEAERLRPDVVVLDLDGSELLLTGKRVLAAAPGAKVIFCARDEMRVLDPGGTVLRHIPEPLDDQLCSEVLAT
jgi:AmiR/NasT family two-component response regulator